jgi:hypothetical protein
MSYQSFRRVAKIYAISHLIAGTLYIPFHKLIPYACNFVSDFLGLPLEHLPLPSEKFWFTLSVSMMYMIAFSAYLTYKGEQFVHTWEVIILSKGASTLLFFLFFLFDVRAFAYICGVLVDGPLFAIALYTYRKYRQSKLSELKENAHTSSS